MSPPGQTATLATAKNHPPRSTGKKIAGSGLAGASVRTAPNVETPRPRRPHRDLLLQCQTCGAKGTLFERDGTKALPVQEGRQQLVNRAWRHYQDAYRRGREAEAEDWLRRVRELRRGKMFFVHVDCGGTCLPYDIRGSGSAHDAIDIIDLVMYAVALRCDKCSHAITWAEIWYASNKIERVARHVARAGNGTLHSCGGTLRV